MSAPPPGRTVPGNRWDLLDGQWPAEPPLVTVIVVHHRQPAELDRTLRALRRQTHPRAEIVVVDDGSPEPPAVPSGVRLLVQPDRGFRAAAARNLGARHAAGSVLCFLDADTVPEPDYVRRLSRLPALAPEAVSVGWRGHAALASAAPEAPVERAGPVAALPGPTWLAAGYAETANLLHADARSYRFVLSAVLGCSAWLFGELGGFDERFDEYGGEDWEWAHRAWRAGALLQHEPAARAWHDGPDWAGRGDAASQARRAAKNRESLRLAQLIPVPGSRPRALRTARPDVLVRLERASSAAAAFLCVDSVLEALPEATVVVPERLSAVFAPDGRVVVAPPADPARVVVTLPGPVQVTAGPLRDAVARVGADAPGTLELTSDDGSLLARLRSGRAAARAARWGTEAHFPVHRERARFLAPTPAEPDLEAHLGGWGHPPGGPG